MRYLYNSIIKLPLYLIIALLSCLSTSKTQKPVYHFSKCREISLFKLENSVLC